MESSDWNPAPGDFVVDGNGRAGVVSRAYEGSVYLRGPYPGDREWAVPPHELRRPTDAERPGWARGGSSP
ncbi:hypothetical protein ABT160_37540 [Streptomyces sp. NPDC001941]|uniref:hypothetical protein n=1 Tax=Streptomyces sp. NPDC001941 TaxID=3154659 RepID=UPI00332CC602